MIWIPPGPFIMGTNEQDTEGKGFELGQTKPWFEDESPEHTVNLPGFYLDRYEVTVADFANFVRKNRAVPPVSWKNGVPPPDSDRLPVSNVTWDQAEAYCAWAGKRLPTEAEWEKAARGPDGLIFPWGNEFDPDRANLLSKGSEPVGSRPQGASPYKVEDLVGNVWEWTSDWYEPYPGNAYPSDNYGRRYKVIRGKSWTEGYGHFSKEDSDAILRHEARASYRLFFDPAYNFGDLGFRCAQNGS
jgi:formylglycine-generating enzyme required for sulfatase activity